MNEATPPQFYRTDGSELDPSQWQTTLFSKVLDAKATFGGNFTILSGSEGDPLSYDRIVLGAVVLGRQFAKISKPADKVGVLLPNVPGVGAVVLALNAFGRVPAMLNFSAGIRNLKAAVATAEIETVVTARSFIAKAELADEIEALGEVAEIVYLEDVRKSLGTTDKLRGLWDSKRAAALHARHGGKPDDVAVVLFTSGSEGVPKGVALSNSNILANCQQFITYEKITNDDRLFNALPVFHSFGLTVGLVAPMTIGMHTYLYPSPLHYKQIPSLVKRSESTIVLGTDTFAAGWAKAADPDDFKSVRLTVLGAEKVKEPTRKLWRERFGLELLEGYGVTEAAPAVAANRPWENREGSVGRMMPGMEARLEAVQGLDHGGRLHIRGPNIMAGYYFHDSPGRLHPPDDGWHDTGDIVSIDENGFIFIRGRAKRFAKIGGEMVSLAAVEAYCSEVWPEFAHAVVPVSHAKKGESLVLVTEKPEAERADLLSWAKLHGVSELTIPRTIISVEALPVMGTGKIDFNQIEDIAKSGG